eukprot:366297-Chlamydomonas_euryale.AAC.6
MIQCANDRALALVYCGAGCSRMTTAVPAADVPVAAKSTPRASLLVLTDEAQGALGSDRCAAVCFWKLTRLLVQSLSNTPLIPQARLPQPRVTFSDHFWDYKHVLAAYM